MRQLVLWLCLTLAFGGGCSHHAAPPRSDAGDGGATVADQAACTSADCALRDAADEAGADAAICTGPDCTGADAGDTSACTCGECTTSELDAGPSTCAQSCPGPGPAVTVHIAYIDIGQKALMLARRAPGETAWTTTQVDSDSLFGDLTMAGTEILLDSKRNPHIAYAIGTYLRYTRWDGTQWVGMAGNPGHDQVDTGAVFTGCTKNYLALQDDAPRIAFRNLDTLKYYWWEGASWHSEVALPLWPATGEPNPGGGAALTLAPDGTPHVAHYDFHEYHVNYSKRLTDGSWTNVMTCSPQQSGGCNHIALDALGNPHITFATGYTRWNGRGWVKADGRPGYDAFHSWYIPGTITPGGVQVLGEHENDGVYLHCKELGGTCWSDAVKVFSANPTDPYAEVDIKSDGSGALHLAVSADNKAENSTDVIYVHHDGSGWVAEKLNAQGTGYRHRVPAIVVE